MAGPLTHTRPARSALSLSRTPRTQNLALLLSDMKGFTARTSRQTREENARMLALHDDLLLPVARKFGGRWFGGRNAKTIGDALLIAFRSPTDCVLCGTAMQDRLAAYNAQAPAGESIEVRIAITLGEVQVEAGDVHGEPVQLVLDVSGLAEPGEVVLTDAVYLAMNKSEAPTELLGPRTLRGGNTVRLHRARGVPGGPLPFGGAALARLGRMRDPASLRLGRLRLQLRRLGGRVDRLLQPIRAHAPRYIALSVLLVLGACGSAVAYRHSRDPLVRAQRLVHDREPLAALSELDRLADTERSRAPAVQVVRGKAEQAMGELGMAFSDFAAAADLDPTVIDDEALRALTDDLDADSFPPRWRPALVRLLGETLGHAAAPELRRLLSSARGQARQDALEALELSGAATDDDRTEVARADLSGAETSCPKRVAAVARLAYVADARARELLSSAASGGQCGSREAADALRRLERLTAKR